VKTCAPFFPNPTPFSRSSRYLHYNYYNARAVFLFGGREGNPSVFCCIYHTSRGPSFSFCLLETSPLFLPHVFFHFKEITPFLFSLLISVRKKYSLPSPVSFGGCFLYLTFSSLCLGAFEENQNPARIHLREHASHPLFLQTYKHTHTFCAPISYS